MKLTQAAIDAIPSPPLRRVALSDGDNLYLIFEKRGRPGWLLKYRLAGRPKTFSVGRYPDVTLEAARAAAATARKQIKDGINPASVRQSAKDAVYVAAANTFEKAAREFLAKDDTKAKRTSDKHEWLFGLLTSLHPRSLTAIDAPLVLRVLEGIAASGKREAARRCGQFIGRVFRHAINRGYCQINPAANLRGELPPVKTESHAGIIDPVQFGSLMQLVDAPGYSHATVYNGLRLLARTALRPGELRQGLWSEVDLTKAEWVIPAHRMKMRRPHLVPLSTQAIAILKDQHRVSGDGVYIFPGVRTGRPMSDAGMGVSLKNMFIPAEAHVPHGFRVSFSTILNERGYDSALVELQLSHAKRDKVAGIYDRSQRVPERRTMMQDWSDMIEKMKAHK
jgi:integrase